MLQIGPVIGRWNSVLEKHFPLRAAGQSASANVSVPALAKRVAVDQLFMAPIGVSSSSREFYLSTLTSV
jgi:protein Mpv17